MVEHEVSYRVGTLDRIGVAVEGLKEPWISSVCQRSVHVDAIEDAYSAAMNSRDFLSVQSCDDGQCRVIGFKIGWVLHTLYS